MKGLYAGSFDPFTIGHLSIVNQSLAFIDKVVIGIGYNENKKCEWPTEVRVNALREYFKDNDRVNVMAYQGLTAIFAKENNIDVLIRGLRNSIDFEKEKELADINREVLGVPTVFIPCIPSLAFVSSSMVRELIHNGFDAKEYMVGNFPTLNKLN